MRETFDEILADDQNNPELNETETEAAKDAIDGIVNNLLPLETEEQEPEETESEEEPVVESETEVVEDMEDLSALTNWLAMQQLEEDPNSAMDALMVSATAARYAGLQPSLWSYVTGQSLEAKTLAAIAHIAPKLNAAQRRELLERFKALPEEQSLRKALNAEKILMLQDERQRIDVAATAWREQARADSDLRFPDNLRIAGIVQIDGQPVQISLHNIVSQHTFWIEEGTEKHGIYCDEVNTATQRAWIRLGDEYAQVDLRAEQIINRHVPWEVIFELYEINTAEMNAEELLAKKKSLAAIGIEPNNLLGNLDRIERFYLELDKHLDGPAQEREKWQQAQLDELPDGLSQKEVLAALPELLNQQAEAELRRGAFEAGMSYLENVSDTAPSEIQVGETTYTIENDDRGFTVTTKSKDSDEAAEPLSLRFGDPEEIGEED